MLLPAFDRKVWTLDLPGLIRAKRAAGRPKDLLVLPDWRACWMRPTIHRMCPAMRGVIRSDMKLNRAGNTVVNSPKASPRDR